MSDNEYMSIKDVISEMREDHKIEHKETMDNFYELKVLIAGDYVKKEECKICQTKNDTAHSQFIGWIIGLFSFIIVVAGITLAIIKG